MESCTGDQRLADNGTSPSDISWQSTRIIKQFSISHYVRIIKLNKNNICFYLYICVSRFKEKFNSYRKVTSYLLISLTMDETMCNSNFYVQNSRARLLAYLQTASVINMDRFDVIRRCKAIKSIPVSRDETIAPRWFRNTDKVWFVRQTNWNVAVPRSSHNVIRENGEICSLQGTWRCRDSWEHGSRHLISLIQLIFILGLR